MNAATDKLTVRVFFALWPKDAERPGFASWQGTLQALCGGRTMRPDTLHATLVFLGEVSTDRLEALKLAAEEVSSERFDLCFDQARYWGHNHILYAAPATVPRQLSQLVRKLEDSMRRHRFAFDQREYQPHVTLLRNARWRDVPLPDMPPVNWNMVDFVLLQSDHQSGGVNYRVLARFPLGDVSPFTG